MSAVSCEEVLRDIELYVDGELDHARSLELYEHLQECSSCLGRADFRRTLKAVVRSKWGPQAPEELFERIAESIRASERPTGR
jgi:mycothiol system anti-sigma-R factor